MEALLRNHETPTDYLNKFSGSYYLLQARRTWMVRWGKLSIRIIHEFSEYVGVIDEISLPVFPCEQPILLLGVGIHSLLEPPVQR